MTARAARTGRTTPALVFAAVVALVGGCGIPTDDDARLTADDDVPFGLLDDDREPTPVDGAGGATIVEVYLYAEGEAALVPVARRVEDPSLTTALAELEREPTEVETSAGLRSALTGSEVIVGVDTTGDTATVDLGDGFSSATGPDQLVAIAQAVLTATARPGISQVAFTLESRPIEIPRGDGTLTSGAVTRDDYADGALTE